MHSSLHFAIGVWIGIITQLPILYNAIKTNTATPIGRLIIVSYSLGFLAIIPNILRQIGYPEEICASPLMNIFLLHPLFDKVYSGGMLMGEAAIITAFSFQYILILLGIKYCRK